MPTNSFRLGVAGVQLSVDDVAALGTCAAVVPTVTSLAPLVPLFLNDIKRPLPVTLANGDMKIVIAQVGRDATHGGFSVGASTAEIDVPIHAAGTGIHINIPNASLPANVSKAGAFAAFLKIGQADYQLAQFGYVDASRDFDLMIKSRPLITAPYFTAALLAGLTQDDYLGDRTPLGYTFKTLGPSSGGVNVTRTTETIELNPDSGPAFKVAVTRSTDVAFKLMSNDILDIIRAAAGDYAKYTVAGGSIEEAEMSLATAQAILTGNRPFKLILPRNSAGFQESRLYLGGLTVNQQQIEEAWTKGAPTLIDYNFQTAIQDTLIVDQHVEIIKRFNF